MSDNKINVRAKRQPDINVTVTRGGQGPEGKSAYQVWLEEGNTGSEQDFLDSLQGEPGEGVPTGGTIGQVLTKNSGSDYDTEWTDPAQTYTDEMAQDAVGNILTDSSSVDLNYNDAGPSITASVKPEGVDHSQLSNIDSSSYSHLTAAQRTDLTDGGDSSLHYHSADRSRTNHTGTQDISTINGLQDALDEDDQDLADHIGDTNNPHGVTKSQVGLGNVDNTSDINKPISTATQTALDGKVDENSSISGSTKTKITYDSKGLVTAGSDATTDDIAEGLNNQYFTNDRADARISAQKGQPNGVATLGSDSKIPTSQLPALAITETFVVNSEVDMLALDAQPGDVAVRTDENKSYILVEEPADDIDNWQELLTPTDTVLSVNGYTGVVTLTTSDISEGTNLYFTDERAQDAVGSMLTDSSSIDFTYDDAGGTFTAEVIPGGVDHALLDNLNSSNYSHLTAAQLTDFTDGGDSTLHYHASDRDRANHTGTQESSTISDFTEATQDAIGSILADSATIDFTYNDGTPSITATVIQSGIDHGSISGLTDDDHTQYFLLAGRSGGQTGYGGTASGNGLTLSSTSHPTKGKIFFGSSNYVFDEANSRFGIGTGSPQVGIHAVAGFNADGIRIEGSSASSITPVFALYDGTTQGTTFSLAGSNGAGLTNSVAGDAIFKNAQNFAILFGTNNTERMRISKEGYVGIGVTSPTALLHISGPVSASSWTTSGIGIRFAGGTFTDTTSSGTVNDQAINSIQSPTVAASSATTYTNYSTLRIAGAPVAGTNVTITNGYALYLASGASRFDGQIGIGGAPTTTSRLIVNAGTADLSAITTTGNVSTSISGRATVTFATTIIPGAALGTVYGTFNRTTISAASSNTNAITNYYNNYSDIQTGANYTGTITSAYHFLAENPTLGGGVSILNHHGFSVRANTSNGNGITSGTVTNYGFSYAASTAAAASGGTVNNFGGAYAVPSASGAGTTNNYGLFIGTVASAASGTYSFYNQSTVKSVFAGQVVVGATSAAAGLLSVAQASDTSSSGFSMVNAANNASVRIWMNGSVAEIDSGSTGAGVMMLNTGGGRVGIGIAATGRLHIMAGSSTANTAPVKLTAGTVNATAETGAVEYDGTDLFFTPSGTTRRAVVFDTATQTLTGKNLASATNTFASVVTTASSATPSPTGDSRENELYVTAAAAGMTVAAPSGTPAQGNKLNMRFKDNGTARSLAFNAIFRAIGVTLPTTTVISKTLYVSAKYNAEDSKWDVLAVGQEA